MDNRWIQLATDLAAAATSPETLQQAIDSLDPPAELAPLVNALIEQTYATDETTRHLEHLASTDDLTGLCNRRVFAPRIDSMLALASGEAQEFRATLLLFDIDNFKQYNDAHGHAIGDEILRSLANLLRTNTRNHDLLGRIGGDEFAVLFWDNAPRIPGSDPLDSLGILAERFRAAVECSSLPALGTSGQGQLTISGGLATFPEDGTNAEELLAAADAALASAKAAGKNTIVLISNPTEAT